MEEIIDRIESQGGVIRVSELKDEADYKRLLRAERRGEIIRVRQGVYAEPSAMLNTMVDINRIIPNGVVCMYTAWMHYRLTTTVPPAFCVAVERKRKIRIPANPPISIYYWKSENLSFGITDSEVSGYNIRMTDLERSVCDAVKYRNKIGTDLCAEIIRSYVIRKDCNYSKLQEYAAKLRVQTILNKYLEIAIV